eukprot:204260-Pelagomonas_calceolata.AAC.6
MDLDKGVPHGRPEACLTATSISFGSSVSVARVGKEQPSEGGGGGGGRTGSNRRMLRSLDPILYSLLDPESLLSASVQQCPVVIV